MKKIKKPKAKVFVNPVKVKDGIVTSAFDTKAIKKAKDKPAALPVPKPHAMLPAADHKDIVPPTKPISAVELEIPVESHLPGIPRVSKPKKIAPPLAADGSLVPLEIISYHFLKLMERLAAEQGGTSAQALEDLRADIGKRKTPAP